MCTCTVPVCTCIIYTLTLAPVAKGKGTVTISKAQALRFGDAVNILSTVQNGTYTLTGVTKSTNQSSSPTPRGNLYTAEILVVSDADTPITGATVSIKPVSGTQTQKITTDSTGKATFTDLKSNRYIVLAEKKKNKTPPSVLDIQGTNHLVSHSVKLQGLQETRQEGMLQGLSGKPLLIAGLIVFGILIGAGLSLLPRVVRRGKQH